MTGSQVRSRPAGSFPPTVLGARADLDALNLHQTALHQGPSAGRQPLTNIELQRRQSVSRRLDNNFDGLIINPLRSLSDQALWLDVEDFVHNHILGQGEATTSERSRYLTRLFYNGALVARNPRRWENVEGLSPKEQEALRNESAHLLRQSWKLYLTFIVASLGACNQGWVQTSLGAANLSWPFDLTLPRCDESYTAPYFWLFGFVNAVPWFSASLLATWFADPIQNALKLGRRGAIFLAAILTFAACMGSAGSRHWYDLLACRFILGLGMGLKATATPLLMAENSPTSVRGSLVMGWQLFDAFGIFLGYSANLILNNVQGYLAWRLQAGAPIFATIPLLLLVYLCPESPRWYIKHRRYAKAFKSACALRSTDLQGARDVYFIHKQIEVENVYLQQRYRRSDDDTAERKESYGLRFRELFTLRRVWRATLAANIVMVAQQLCGINVISFYSPTLFNNTFKPEVCPTPGVLGSPDYGKASYEELWYGWGTGLCSLLFTFLAIGTIDSWGRRKLLLATFPNMAWAILAAGLSTLAADDSVKRPLFIVFSMLFVAFYSVGEGPVPFTYSAEVFPLSHREVGMGGAVTTNFFFAGLLSLVAPALISAIRVVGTLGLFAALCLVALGLIFFLVPETAGRSLEDQDFVFGVPTARHARYQRDTLRWHVRGGRRRGDERPNLFKTADWVPTFDAGGAAEDDVSVAGGEPGPRPHHGPGATADVAPEEAAPPRPASIPDDVSEATSEEKRTRGRREHASAEGVQRADYAVH